MKNKFFYYLSLILITIMLGICTASNLAYSRFNSNDVLNNISLLSSSTYNGRLPGTTENNNVADIIESEFINNGLTPLNREFKESFTLNCPIKSSSSPYLNIISKDGTVLESLEYGKDYKEDGINFNKNEIIFSNSDIFKVNPYTIQVENNYGRFLFLIPENDNLNFRSSFSDDFQFDCVIMVTSNSYGKILRALKDYNQISVHIPFVNEKKSISNVVGVLEGSDKTLPPLILTAHFDHLGKDGLDNIYGGALDNASGISFLLELQKNLSSLGKPKQDIIFVALNAEEFGLKGSENFTNNNIDKIQNAKVINFDMVGSENYPITLMMPACFEKKECYLYNDIKDICDNKNIKTNVEYKDSSDHASFGNAGLEALTISHSDMRFIHTPEDNIESISPSAIDSVYEVMYEVIVPKYYSNVTLLYHNTYFLITLILLLIGFIVFPIYKKMNK